MEYSEVLEAALGKGKLHHPSAPIQHHGAFANSVAYLVTGTSGGYGGPSCREHAVTHSALLGGKQTTAAGMNAFVPAPDTLMPGQWKYEAACDFADPICYGPIADLHQRCYRTEHCFDDAEEDIAALKKWQHQGDCP